MAENANTVNGQVVADSFDVSGNTVPEQSISTADLPWATVLLPTTSSGTGGFGANKHGLVPESWVFGFFADGDDCQQPVIVGTIPGGPGGGTYGGRGQGYGAGNTTPATPLSGSVSDRAKTVANILMQKGFSKEQAAGILGNLLTENDTLDPNRQNGIGATGICQWLGPRKKAMYAKCGTNPSLECQVEYLVDELRGAPSAGAKESTANRLLANATTPQDAAIAFCSFERGEDYSATLARRNGGSGCTAQNSLTQRRISKALGVYQQLGNPQPETTTAPQPQQPTSPSGPTSTA